MTDYENCPVCRKDLPADLEANFCPFCGVRFDPNASEHPEIIESPPPEDEPHAEERQDEKTQAGIAWESQTGLGFLQRLTQTWLGSLFNTARFFRNMKITQSIKMAFLYGLLLNTTGYIFLLFWQRKILELLEQRIQSMPVEFAEMFRPMLETAMAADLETQFLLAPFRAIFLLFFFSLILHISFSMLVSTNKNFAATFRIVAYAESTSIFYALPLLGPFIVFFFWLYVLVIGTREIHETTNERAFLGTAIPLLLCCCANLIISSNFMPSLFG